MYTQSNNIILDQIVLKRLIKIDSLEQKKSKVGSNKNHPPYTKGQLNTPFGIEKKFLSYVYILGLKYIQYVKLSTDYIYYVSFQYITR